MWPTCRYSFFFYLSLGLVRVCEINRIHHWCSFSHIPMLIATVRYGTDSIISAGDVTESMTRAVQINLKQRINSAFNNEQIVISSKWMYKNLLIRHINSNKLFCWGKCFFFLHRQGSPSLCMPSTSNMPIAIHSACSKH